MEYLLSWLFSVLLFGTAYQSFLDVHNLPILEITLQLLRGMSSAGFASVSSR